MSLQVQGRITHITPLQTGISGAGKEWKKQNFVIETQDQYPKSIAFTLFGDEKIAALTQYAVGAEVNVFFNLESREYQGRWFSNVNAWKIEAGSANNANPQAPAPPIPSGNKEGSADDLPF